MEDLTGGGYGAMAILAMIAAASVAAVGWWCLSKLLAGFHVKTMVRKDFESTIPLDLHEPVVKLWKVQEASRYIPNLKKKKKEKKVSHEAVHFEEPRTSLNKDEVREDSGSSNPTRSSVPKAKVQSPNLIARLMGLEEMPSLMVKKMKKERIISHGRRSHFLDIDLPTPTKPQIVERRLQFDRFGFWKKFNCLSQTT